MNTSSLTSSRISSSICVALSTLARIASRSSSLGCCGLGGPSGAALLALCQRRQGRGRGRGDAGAARGCEARRTASAGAREPASGPRAGCRQQPGERARRIGVGAVSSLYRLRRPDAIWEAAAQRGRRGRMATRVGWGGGSSHDRHHDSTNSWGGVQAAGASRCRCSCAGPARGPPAPRRGGLRRASCGTKRRAAAAAAAAAASSSSIVAKTRPLSLTCGFQPRSRVSTPRSDRPIREAARAPALPRAGGAPAADLAPSNLRPQQPAAGSCSGSEGSKGTRARLVRTRSLAGGRGPRGRCPVMLPPRAPAARAAAARPPAQASTRAPLHSSCRSPARAAPAASLAPPRFAGRPHPHPQPPGPPQAATP
jgi:hypothetical protein